MLDASTLPSTPWYIFTINNVATGHKYGNEVPLNYKFSYAAILVVMVCYLFSASSPLPVGFKRFENCLVQIGCKKTISNSGHQPESGMLIPMS